jgi:glycosyltransferase involved in cell wall biosynthesis
MLRVAFFLDTRNVSSIDIRDVDAGNPGIGGTEYMFFLIASYLAKTHSVAMYVTAPGLFPAGITYHVVRDLSEAATHLETQGETMLILRESDVLPNLQQLHGMKQKVLVWAHNYSGHKTLKACVKCPSIVRYLCVSKEQYEQLRDESVFAKADYVFNAAVTRSYPTEAACAGENNVFYMGSLIEMKGFHVLARYWKDIVAKVPDAKLHVIGSGQLYDKQAVLGPMGIASVEYERRFAKDVTEGGELRRDIIFHGTLGAGKTELLKRAKVAVANPTGVGETFCITALEFALLGVPVVTKNLGGPRNVIVDGKTGILYARERHLPEAVVTLLTQDGLRHEMGRNAMTFARDHFDIEIVLERWVKILQAVHLDEAVRPDFGITMADDRYKQLKEWNRIVKSIRCLSWLPSLDYWVHAFVKKRDSWLVNPIKRVVLRRMV